MRTYFGILRQHGLKLWASFLLGSFAAGIAFFMASIIVLLLGGLFVMIGGGAELKQLQFVTGPEEALDLFIQSGLAVVLVIVGLIILFFGLVVAAFDAGGKYGALKEAVFQDRSSLGTYFSSGFRHLWKMLLQSLLTLLISSPVWILFIVAAFSIFDAAMSQSPGGFLVGGLLILIGIIAAVLVGLILLHAPVILITEGKGVGESIALSFRLFRKSFGQVFLSGLLYFLIFLVVYGTFALIGFILALAAGMSGNAEQAEVFPVVVEILMRIADFFIAPFVQLTATLVIVFRYKHRLRHWIVSDDNGDDDNGTTPPDAPNPKPYPRFPEDPQLS